MYPTAFWSNQCQSLPSPPARRQPDRFVAIANGRTRYFSLLAATATVFPPSSHSDVYTLRLRYCSQSHSILTRGGAFRLVAACTAAASLSAPFSALYQLTDRPSTIDTDTDTIRAPQSGNPRLYIHPATGAGPLRLAQLAGQHNTRSHHATNRDGDLQILSRISSQRARLAGIPRFLRQRHRDFRVAQLQGCRQRHSLPDHSRHRDDLSYFSLETCVQCAGVRGGRAAVRRWVEDAYPGRPHQRVGRQHQNDESYGDHHTGQWTQENGQRSNKIFRASQSRRRVKIGLSIY